MAQSRQDFGAHENGWLLFEVASDFAVDAVWKVVVAMWKVAGFAHPGNIDLVSMIVLDDCTLAILANRALRWRLLQTIGTS